MRKAYTLVLENFGFDFDYKVSFYVMQIKLIEKRLSLETLSVMGAKVYAL